MSNSDRTKVIPLASPRTRRSPKTNLDKKEGPSPDPGSAFLYTVELLISDFGKNHRAQRCALCEPMKVMGLHRDEVMVKLTVELFVTFFPSFEDYLLELKESLMQSLLKRDPEARFDSWQAKLKSLLFQQVKDDIADFYNDVLKHLVKQGGVSIEPGRQKRVLSESFKILKDHWMK